jgi:hypothetical protein
VPGDRPKAGARYQTAYRVFWVILLVGLFHRSRRVFIDDRAAAARSQRELLIGFANMDGGLRLSLQNWAGQQRSLLDYMGQFMSDEFRALTNWVPRSA